MILATAAPLALPQEKPQEAAGPKPAIFAEKRSSAALSGPVPGGEYAQAGAAELSPPVFANVKEKRPEAQPLQARPLRVQAAQVLSLSAQRDENRRMHLSYENILALVQTGEKALKNEKPVIEIERRER